MTNLTAPAIINQDDLDNLYIDWSFEYTPATSKVSDAFKLNGIEYSNIKENTSGDFVYDYEKGNLFSSLMLDPQELTSEELQDCYDLVESWVEYLNDY